VGLKWAENLALMGKTRKAYIMLVEKPSVKWHIEDQEGGKIDRNLL
jgi:hypothetical protein